MIALAKRDDAIRYVRPIEALDLLNRCCQAEQEREPSGKEYREALEQARQALKVLRRFW